MANVRGIEGGPGQVRGGTVQGDPEFRLARYIKNRNEGDNHATALRKLNDAVNAGDKDQIAQQYAEIIEPTVTFANRIKNALVTAHHATPYATLDPALTNYIANRGLGQAHGLAAAALNGLGLTPENLNEIDKAYTDAKMAALTDALETAAGNVQLPQNVQLPANLRTPIMAYIRRRLRGVNHGGAVAQTIWGGQRAGLAGVFTAINLAYTNNINAPAGLTAARLRGKCPQIGLEYSLLPYIQSRQNGNTHVVAVATLPAHVDQSVRNNLNTAYANTIMNYNPRMRATRLSNWLRGLGINQFTAPEIGQIFGSKTPSLSDEDSKRKHQKTGARLDTSKTGWGYHFGTVVAKDGSDTITLENYARAAEEPGGVVGATRQEFYFQMYGTGAGQSWHEAWTSAGRPVINAVTMTIGKKKKDVWKEQLDNIPAFEAGVNAGTYATQLAAQKDLIDNAADVPAAKVAYYAALTALIRHSLTAHRTKADQVAKRNFFFPRLVPTLVPADLSALNAINDGNTVANEIDQWINTHTNRRNNIHPTWGAIKRAVLQDSITQLTNIRNKLRELVTYHNARHV